MIDRVDKILWEVLFQTIVHPDSLPKLLVGAMEQIRLSNLGNLAEADLGFFRPCMSFW